MSLVADILVCRGIHDTYTYRIPEENASDYQVGAPVKIPVGRGMASGVLIATSPLSDTNIDPSKLKYIDSLDPGRPTAYPEQIELIMWMAKTYLVTPYQAYQTVLGRAKLRELETQTTLSQIATPEYPLNTAQKAAIKRILSRDKNEYLIHGVTGSGKTEVYMQVAQQIIESGKQVIMLVPEIALTPQFRKRFTDRFGNRIAVVHSKLTPKKREEAWTRIHRQEISIVIGPRSAIFVPLQNLGAIILDEEHESSYKQENNPRYDTIAVARFRQSQSNATLVLGSATPRLESYHQATTDPNVGLIEMPDRIDDRPMPTTHIIDSSDTINSIPSILSPQLISAISETLARHEKVMILINRRGYAPHVKCQKCGHTLDCPECHLSMTYHQDRKFRCHRCSITQDITHTCPSCKKQSLVFAGIGIQKVEAELKHQFPNRAITRMDRDTTSTQRKLEKVLKEFEESGDILVGTQLIAKGHDIHSVTLVGVVGIDAILSIPDFRSCERTFQLLTQVSGRAGRGEAPGQVIVQTQNPSHYAIQCAAQHDFATFFESELKFRQLLNYPPFSDLINIVISGEDPQEVKRYIEQVSEIVKCNNDESNELDWEVLGPKPAPIEKIKNRYRRNLVLKGESLDRIQLYSKLKEIEKTVPRSLRQTIDINPRNLL